MQPARPKVIGFKSAPQPSPPWLQSQPLVQLKQPLIQHVVQPQRPIQQPVQVQPIQQQLPPQLPPQIQQPIRQDSFVAPPLFVKKKSGPNANGISTLQQIQAKVREIKMAQPELGHRAAIAIAGEEYRAEHGTTRAHVKKKKPTKRR